MIGERSSSTRLANSGEPGFQRLAALLICLCVVLFMLYVGSSIFIPITYGIFFSLMLKPIADRFERLIGSRVLAAGLTLFTAGLAVLVIILFFINQIQEVLTEAEDIMSGLEETFFEVVLYGGERFGLSAIESEKLVEDSINGVLAAPFDLLTSGISVSGLLLANLTLILIYTFFFLLYRTALKNFVLGQLRTSSQLEGAQTLREVQTVAKSYLGGLGLVMIILGVLNSVGLYLIGIDYYLVWGFLAAVLAIIPYIGTTIGGTLPFLYAIATTETFWQPAGVVILYTSVQFIEGNLITPKVVGNSVKINALAAIIAILVGGIFWGIAGIILAIPLLAIVRIVMKHIDPLRPLALLLSDDLYSQSEKFLTEFNQPRYKLTNIFSGKTALTITPRRKRLTKLPSSAASVPEGDQSEVK